MSSLSRKVAKTTMNEIFKKQKPIHLYGLSFSISYHKRVFGIKIKVMITLIFITKTRLW